MDVAELTDQLCSDDAAVRGRAAELLTRHPQASAAAVPLVRAAGDPDETVREWACAALEAELVPSPADLSAIVQLLGDPNHDVAYWAATLIGRQGTAAGSAVSPLLDTLDESRSPAVRERAVWALGRIGPPARPALGRLKSLAASDQPRLARLATSALKRISQE